MAEFQVGLSHFFEIFFILLFFQFTWPESIFENLCRPWERPSIKSIARWLRDAFLQVWVVYSLVVVFYFIPLTFMQMELICFYSLFFMIFSYGHKSWWGGILSFLNYYSLADAELMEMSFRSLSSNHITMYRQLTD